MRERVIRKGERGRGGRGRVGRLPRVGECDGSSVECVSRREWEKGESDGVERRRRSASCSPAVATRTSQGQLELAARLTFVIIILNPLSFSPIKFSTGTLTSCPPKPSQPQTPSQVPSTHLERQERGPRTVLTAHVHATTRDALSVGDQEERDPVRVACFARGADGRGEVVRVDPVRDPLLRLRAHTAKSDSVAA